MRLPMDRDEISGVKRGLEVADESAESNAPLAVDTLDGRIDALNARLDRLEKKLDEGFAELKALVKFWR